MAKSKLKIKRGNAVVRPMPFPGQTGFQAKHDTAAERKAQHSTDVKRIQKMLGPDWRKKIYGDVKRFQSNTKRQRYQQRRIKGLQNKESKLASRNSVTQEALGQRITATSSNYPQKVSQIEGKSGVSAPTYWDKRRFQRAARKAYNQESKQKATNLSAAVKDGAKHALARPVYRNPNSPYNIRKRKQKARAALQSK